MPSVPKNCSRTPEEQVGYLLKRLMHQFRHQVEDRLRRGCDMSLAHLVTLDQLQQEPGIAGARLARRLLVTAQTMTGLLRCARREGLIFPPAKRSGLQQTITRCAGRSWLRKNAKIRPRSR